MAPRCCRTARPVCAGYRRGCRSCRGRGNLSHLPTRAGRRDVRYVRCMLELPPRPSVVQTVTSARIYGCAWPAREAAAGATLLLTPRATITTPATRSASSWRQAGFGTTCTMSSFTTTAIRSTAIAYWKTLMRSRNVGVSTNPGPRCLLMVCLEYGWTGLPPRQGGSCPEEVVAHWMT